MRLPSFARRHPWVGLLIVVFSTVTTTFLDAWSAGISAETIAPKFKGKQVALIVKG